MHQNPFLVGWGHLLPSPLDSFCVSTLAPAAPRFLRPIHTRQQSCRKRQQIVAENGNKIKLLQKRQQFLLPGVNRPLASPRYKFLYTPLFHGCRPIRAIHPATRRLHYSVMPLWRACVDVRVCSDACSDNYGCCVPPAPQPIMMLVQQPQPQPQPQCQPQCQQLPVKCGTTAFVAVPQRAGCATEEQTKEAVFTMDQAPCKPCNVQCF